MSDFSQSSRSSRANGNGAHDIDSEDASRGGDLTTDLALLRDDVAKLAESITQMLPAQGDMAGRLRDMANGTYETASEAAGIFSRAGSGVSTDMQQRWDAFSTELRDLVNRAPLTTVALAAFAGLIYGKLRR